MTLPGGSSRFCIEKVHSCVNQRAEIVYLVLPYLQPAIQAPLMARFHKLRVGVDVTVRIDSGCSDDAVNVAVQLRFERGIGMLRRKSAEPRIIS